MDWELFAIDLRRDDLGRRFARLRNNLPHDFTIKQVDYDALPVTHRYHGARFTDEIWPLGDDKPSPWDAIFAITDLTDAKVCYTAPPQMDALLASAQTVLS